MQGPSRWLAEAELPDLCPDETTRGWLLERGSLTQRLRGHWGDVAVRVVEEGLAVPLAHEARRLGRPDDTVAWVRCVLLVCRGRPRIYARTVIPEWGPRNPWRQVQDLGRQPLGELLFSLPDLDRSAFEWSLDRDWPHAAHWLAPNTPALSAAPARRCVFGREGAPLLLTEVFLDLGAPSGSASAAGGSAGRR